MLYIMLHHIYIIYQIQIKQIFTPSCIAYVIDFSLNAVSALSFVL